MPEPRGPVSEWVVARLASYRPSALPRPPDTPSTLDDEAIALWTLHELSYQGFEDATELAESDPDVSRTRFRLEATLESRLRERWVRVAPTPAEVPEALEQLAAQDAGPSLADHVRRHADADQVLEMLRQRSIYQLKEADPTTWVVPRLPTRAKAALMELQFDEYGNGNPNRLHAHLFARGLDAVGLCADYGAYVDGALPETLELNNALSMFGLNRRLRGAAMGHLAAFEMSSSIPARKIAQGLDRLGLAGPMSAYYDEHVEADAVHEITAAHAICGTLAEDEPDQAAEIMFGAFTCLDLEGRMAGALLDSWRSAA
ncbi:iron-containing redox enzyme family protein [Nocardioides hwasunensis]|nr:iron-containing redox enzyme family protein [Nocardioides hwasunensis]